MVLWDVQWSFSVHAGSQGDTTLSIAEGNPANLPGPGWYQTADQTYLFLVTQVSNGVATLGQPLGKNMPDGTVMIGPYTSSGGNNSTGSGYTYTGASNTTASPRQY